MAKFRDLTPWQKQELARVRAEVEGQGRRPKDPFIWLNELTDAAVGTGVLAVGAKLRRHDRVDKDWGRVVLSQGTMASDIRTSKSTVQRSTKWLSENGWVAIIPSGHNGSGWSLIYVCMMPGEVIKVQTPPPAGKARQSPINEEGMARQSPINEEGMARQSPINEEGMARQSPIQGPPESHTHSHGDHLTESPTGTPAEDIGAGPAGPVTGKDLEQRRPNDEDLDQDPSPDGAGRDLDVDGEELKDQAVETLDGLTAAADAPSEEVQRIRRQAQEAESRDRLKVLSESFPDAFKHDLVRKAARARYLELAS